MYKSVKTNERRQDGNDKKATTRRQRQEGEDAIIKKCEGEGANVK